MIRKYENHVFRYYLNIKAFESVLKKFKFINEVIIKTDFKNEEQVLQTISNNCLNLNSFTFRFAKLEIKSLIDFGLKCGQNLEKIDFGFYSYRDERLKPFIKLCPNLKT
jgi:hypothetical protein